MQFIDFRSDTVTWPTPAMRAAMAAAPVGDDVYGDDPTVNELEALAAKMVGKESALFVPSGTFGNQLALFTWCPRGSEVILGEQCHIIQHEAGAASIIAGVQTRAILAPDGILPIAEVAARVRGDDIHYPPTSLICVENAHSSGRVIPLEYMKELAAFARSRSLSVHLDGARLFNAAAALGCQASGIASTVDSLMFCLSKGLCAPVGSILAGSKIFVDKARRKRKIMGGGMRQAGILASAGIIALRDMTGRLAEDHENARYLAEKLAALPGFAVDMSALDINMVFFKLPSRVDGADLSVHLAANGVLASPPEGGISRFVAHYWIGKEHIDKAVGLIAAFLAARPRG
ncbi:MAG: low-specificity L-threonine aldolase [Spirochaetae bacterium HGW-Spirochaetae-9]|nr:MAG: low-specificity L-threonine aldolase [Spirochaetae bacterium HGW-Spirochaetae-9]